MAEETFGFSQQGVERIVNVVRQVEGSPVRMQRHRRRSVSVGGSDSPLTTKGDLYTHDATEDDRLPVGTDGQVLTAASGEDTGLKWVGVGGGAAADGPAGNASESLSGTTADAFATLIDVSSASGILGVVAIRNTGGTWALNFSTTLYSAFGGSSNNNVSVSAGNDRTNVVEVLGPAFPLTGPWVRVVVEVQTNNPGNHTTYAFKSALVLM